MEYHIKVEERKKFLHFFRVWIVLAAVLLAAWGVLALLHKPEEKKQRNNPNAPAQRVYDLADILSDQEEKHLEQVIAECEAQGTCDIVLVVICEEMGMDEGIWQTNMRDYADDFYDEREFGYNKPFGDGALILDNWYEDENGSQMGTWLSTSGKLEDIVGVYEEDTILDALYDYISSNPAKGYEAAIRKIAYWGNEEGRMEQVRMPWGVVFAVPVVVALIFAFVNLKQAPGKDTTLATTYVAGGKPTLRTQRDVFLRKSVTSVKIETQSSGGGGRSGGGSGGHHTSSGGHSHGGGGRRR